MDSTITTTLTNIDIQINDLITNHFNESIILEARIQSINKLDNSFIIYDKNNKNIECFTTLDDINNLNINDTINLIGKLNVSKNKIGNIYLDVEFFYRVDEQENIENKMNSYYENKKYILSKKQLLHQISNQKIPSFIRNIGLIMVESDVDNTEQIKTKFMAQCTGKLLICKLKKNNLDKQLVYCLEYFKKYHNIDMICINIDKISTEDMLCLYSKENLKYLMNRKQFPYLVYVSNYNIEKQLFPLLTNKYIQNMETFIDFIQDIQKNFMNGIQSMIEYGNNEINIMIEKYTNQIMDVDEIITKRLSFFGIETPKYILDKIKSSVIKHIDDLINDLHANEILLMTKLMEDEQTINYLDSTTHDILDQSLWGNILTPQIVTPIKLALEETFSDDVILLGDGQPFQEIYSGIMVNPPINNNIETVQEHYFDTETGMIIHVNSLYPSTIREVLINRVDG